MRPRVSFADVVRIVLPRSSVDGMVAMLTAYFDDSGTHGDSDVVVIGGLIGGEQQWTPFEASWKSKLANPLPGKPPLRRFHMAPCMAKVKEFSSYSDGERDAVIHDFRQIILDSDLLGYSCAVSLRDWDSIVGTRSIAGLKDPEFFCMSTAILQAARVAREYTADKQVALVFDNRTETQGANEHIFAMYHQAHNLNVGREEIIGISFLTSEAFVPLQGADMVAWETYDHAKKWLKEGAAVPTRPHLTSLAKTGRFIAHVAGPSARDAWHCEGLEHVGHGVTPLEAFQAWHGAVMLAESKGDGYRRDPRGGPKPRGRFVRQAELKSPRRRNTRSVK